MNMPTPRHSVPQQRAGHRVLIALELFAGIGALAGGIGLIDGNLLRMPDDWLIGTPFTSWVLPGVLLLIVVAAPMLTAAWAELRRRPGAATASIGAGLLQVGWILVQWLVFTRFNWLQPTMLGVGATVLLLAFWLHRSPDDTRESP